MKFKRMFNYLTLIALDAIMIVISYMVALIFLKFIEYGAGYPSISYALAIIIVFKLAVFLLAGVYKVMIDYIDYRGIGKITLITIITNIMIVLALLIPGVPQFLPKSIYIFITPIEVVFLISYRLLSRFSNYLKVQTKRQKQLSKATLIIGAGSAGQMVLKELERNKEYNNFVVGFLDDDKTKVGQLLSNKQVLGAIEDLDRVIEHFYVEEVIVAIKDYPIKKLNDIYNKVNDYENITIKKINVFDDSKTPINIVDVNVEDLLNREQVDLDDEGIASLIKGQVVFVTGGGGSIGSELSRQIFKLAPKELVIFDIYENNAYEIQMELNRRLYKNPKLKTKVTVIIGSVYNYDRLEEVFKEYKPNLVFHAAAYKHVPLMEDSAKEAIRTNVIGTNNAAILADKYQVNKFILVSSDKAVRPTNVMGATKRFAELIVNCYNSRSKTNYASVRFGNVLGSNGSVVPLFKNQIADGGPVTLTHKEITRYFMTIPEAVGLILQCAVYAEGGEVFILDMGEPVKIYDLAVKMIRLMGLKPYDDIDIEIVGLRPGEKLYEELLVDPTKNHNIETDHKRIFIETNQQTSMQELDLDYVYKNYEKLSNENIKIMLSKIIKEYKVNGENNGK